MKNRIILSLVTLFILSCFHVNAESKELEKPDVNNPMLYWEKGNNGEKITSEEFAVLITQLEQKLADLKVASSKISIGGAGFSYELGKAWEIELEQMHENIKLAFIYLKGVKNYPDSIAVSLALYITLRDITATASEFARVPNYAETLHATHSFLSVWSIAFQKAHLIPLAILKDKQPSLNEKETKAK